jgi:hypothetical protein
MVWCPRTSLRGWAPTRWPRWKISTMLALARTLDDLVQEHIVHGVVVTVHLDVVVRPARSSIRPRRRVLWGGAERDSVRGARTDPGGSPGRGAWYGF